MKHSFTRPGTWRRVFYALPVFLLLAATLPAAQKDSLRKRKSAARPTSAQSKIQNEENAQLAKMEREEVARIASIKSKVEVKVADASQWKAAKSNLTLRSADSIRTGRQSVAQLKLGDGSKILLLQNSQAELENLSSLQKAIKLVRGRVRAVVKRIKSTGASFKIKTPVGVASVRGTEFEVEFIEDGGNMTVDVHSGQVGVSRLGDLSDEVLVNPGEQLKFGAEGDLGDPIRTGAVPLERLDIQTEIMDSKVKDSVIAMAAEESRIADYQVGKSLIDVHGQRVRVEEYIMRPAANQFKLVSLNEREKRFDYFTYTGTFNRALPEDLSVALAEVNGTIGATSPTYYLTEYETKMSNTIDSITDGASGGHLVKISVSADGSQYTLSPEGVDCNVAPASCQVIDAVEFLSSDNTYKIYNPLKDNFQIVTAADLDEAKKISIQEGGAYRNLAANDIAWKTRYNAYDLAINGVDKFGYAKSGANDILSIHSDATWYNPPIKTISENPSGDGVLHNRLTLVFNDQSKLVYNNFIINDEGQIAPAAAFDGLSTSAAYKDELENWNYEQVVTATEFNGRSIDLVVDPRIATISNLIP